MGEVTWWQKAVQGDSSRETFQQIRGPNCHCPLQGCTHTGHVHGPLNLKPTRTYCLAWGTKCLVITSNGKECKKRNTHVTESLYCVPETGTTLQIDCISIKIFKKWLGGYCGREVRGEQGPAPQAMLTLPPSPAADSGGLFPCTFVMFQCKLILNWSWGWGCGC